MLPASSFFFMSVAPSAAKASSRGGDSAVFGAAARGGGDLARFGAGFEASEHDAVALVMSVMADIVCVVCGGEWENESNDQVV